MQRAKRRSKLFYRFLVSYIIIFFIPLTVTSFFIYNRFIGILQEEVVANNLNTLYRVKYVIDNQLLQLQNTTNQIYLNNDLKPFWFNSDPLAAIKAKSVLTGYSAANRFLDEIFLYYNGDNYIYSSNSSYSLDSFCNDMFKYKNWSREDFIRDINTIEKPVFRSAEDVVLSNEKSERYVTMVYPLAAGSMKPYGVVVFLIKENNFRELLKDDIKGYSGNTLILDQNNNIIFSEEEDSPFTSANFITKYESDKQSETRTVTMDGKKYFLAQIKSAQTKWSYITLVSAGEAMNKVTKMQTEFNFILLLIFVLGSITIYFIMNINYAPIKQLKKYAEKLWTGKQQSNEIEAIRSTLDFLSDQNTQLNVRIKVNEEATRQSILMRLLKGEFVEIEDFNRQGQEFQIRFSNSLYMVIIIDFGSEEIEKQKLLADVSSIFVRMFEGYGVDLIGRNSIAFITSTNETCRNIIEDSLVNIKKELKDGYGHSLVIGVGKQYSSLGLIPKSYMEASSAVDYRFVKGNDQIIFFDEIAAENTMANLYPYKDFEQLKVCIVKKDMEAVQTIITNILCFIKENNAPLFIARGICFDLINAINQFMGSMGSEFLLSMGVYTDVFSLVGTETADELVTIINSLCKAMYSFIKTEEESDNNYLIEQITAYINDNYMSCDFSIQDMADKFQLSLPNLSQYFKDKTGYNLIDYVTNLRMEKTKSLLVSTSMSLKDIASEVGYYNVSSFIRRFKQIQGITPGDYRKLYKS